MLGSGAILGAPSLPKFTTRRTSVADRDEAALLPQNRRNATPAETRTRLRSTEPLRIPPSRTKNVAGSSRQAPVAVAGRSSSVVPGRPTVPFQRIIESIPLLRPDKVTRLQVVLNPELQIELSFRGGAVHGVVHAASEAARGRIGSHLDQLRTMLEGKGIKVGDLRVVVASDPPPSESVSQTVPSRVHLVDFLA
jgi:flagellar hook-length control protein FliK